ncbi:hypothetical protein FRC01_012733, partial [Tulasnella sp. 417]
WAIYERDRKVLIALIAGFLACFVPSWTLTFIAGTSGGLDEQEIRVFGNVWLYIGGILMQDGLDGLDWRLRKCYRFHFPKVNNSILLGSLLYESGICAAMVWKMYQDKKKTRIIEAFYRECGFYTAIKSMVCSHIILRLRSYFSDGDPVIDGYDPADPFEEQLGGKVAANSTSSSVISTIIHFAHVLSRPGGDAAFELRSKPVANAPEPAPEQVDEADLRGGGGATNFHVVSSAILSSPNSRLRQELDWTDSPDPHTRRSILGEPSGSHRVESSSPPEQQVPPRRPKAFRKRPSSAGDNQKGTSGPSCLSQGSTQALEARSLQGSTTTLKTGDLTPMSRHGTPRRTISDTDLLTRGDPTPQSTAQLGQPLPRNPQSTAQPDATHERSNSPPPSTDRADRR